MALTKRSLDVYKRQLPTCITASFAFYAAFYRGIRMEENTMIGVRNHTEEYEIKDDKAVLDFFFAHKDDDADAYAHAVCSNIDLDVYKRQSNDFGSSNQKTGYMYTQHLPVSDVFSSPETSNTGHISNPS